MQRVSQALTGRGSGHSRAALPEVIPVLAQNGMRLYRGQTTMIVGQPSSGKSLLALFYAVRLAQQGVRVLYVSMDTDKDTMSMRATANASQRTMQEVAEIIGDEAEFVLEEAINSFDRNLVFEWEPNAGIEEIEMFVLASEEAWGDFAEVIVIDNLLNLATDSENEYSELRRAMAAFHSLARKTDASVVVLHHVSENQSKEDQPAPLKAMHGKVSQFPEAVWSVAMIPTQDLYRICAVKNRNEVHDKKGENYLELFVDAPRMSLYQTRSELAQARTRAEYQ